MESMTIAKEKIAAIKKQGQAKLSKRILYKIISFLEITAESDWKNEINPSAWQCKKWWYWQ